MKKAFSTPQRCNAPLLGQYNSYLSVSGEKPQSLKRLPRMDFRLPRIVSHLQLKGWTIRQAVEAFPYSISCSYCTLDVEMLLFVFDYNRPLHIATPFH
jgi:hypothetical protein